MIFFPFTFSSFLRCYENVCWPVTSFQWGFCSPNTRNISSDQRLCTEAGEYEHQCTMGYCSSNNVPRLDGNLCETLEFQAAVYCFTTSEDIVPSLVRIVDSSFKVNLEMVEPLLISRNYSDLYNSYDFLIWTTLRFVFFKRKTWKTQNYHSTKQKRLQRTEY